MALPNFWGQKNAISALDITGLTGYANALNTCAASLNACWDGNIDKQYVIAAINRQLQAVNQLRQDTDWVRRTADFVLVKLNELGTLTGFSAPYVPSVGAIAFAGNCAAKTRIKLDTNAVRTAADALNGKRANLADSQSSLSLLLKIIDVFILGMWGIGGRLNATSKQVAALLDRHDRIVAVLRRVAETYDNADKRISQKAGGGTSPGVQDIVSWWQRLLDQYPYLKYLNPKALLMLLGVLNGGWDSQLVDNSGKKKVSLFDFISGGGDAVSAIGEAIGDKSRIGSGVSVLGDILYLPSSIREALDTGGKTRLEITADGIDAGYDAFKAGKHVYDYRHVPKNQILQTPDTIPKKLTAKSFVKGLFSFDPYDAGAAIVTQTIRSTSKYAADGVIDWQDGSNISIEAGVAGGLSWIPFIGGDAKMRVAYTIEDNAANAGKHVRKMIDGSEALSKIEKSGAPGMIAVDTGALLYGGLETVVTTTIDGVKAGWEKTTHAIGWVWGKVTFWDEI